jgi:hypothetical protein
MEAIWTETAGAVEERGSAEFGANLNRLSQSYRAPLLGPEHWQVGQALDVEPTWKATLHRGFRQYRGDERERRRHPNRALALLFAHGEPLDGLGRVDEKFVEPAASVAERPDETVSCFRSHGSYGLLRFANAFDDPAATARRRSGSGQRQDPIPPLLISTEN